MIFFVFYAMNPYIMELNGFDLIIWASKGKNEAFRTSSRQHADE
jgi:hypothetical protein